MFKKMMESKKTWEEFCERVSKKYDLLSNGKHFYYKRVIDRYKEFTNDDFILSIMPFFFDKKGIEIEPSGTCCHIYLDNLLLKTFAGDDRDLPLRQACEKAFEIREKELNSGN